MNPPGYTCCNSWICNRKIASYIPKANLNIICSQGFKGKKEISSNTQLHL